MIHTPYQNDHVYIQNEPQNSCRGVGTYTDARTGPDKVLGKLYHKSSQGQSNLTKMQY